MPRRKVMTLEEVLAVYYQDCQVQGYKDSTIRGYQRTFRCFLRWSSEVGVTTIPDFTADTVKRYIVHVQQKPKWADNVYVPTQAETRCCAPVRLPV